MSDGPSDALDASAEGSGEFTNQPSGAVVSSCPSKTKSWIDFQLVDKAGNPIAGEAYRLTLADGSVMEGVLDAQGCAGAEVIDPGKCSVVFPNRGDRERSVRKMP